MLFPSEALLFLATSFNIFSSFNLDVLNEWPSETLDNITAQPSPKHETFQYTCRK
jgi:hypothetical protein